MRGIILKLNSHIRPSEIEKIRVDIKRQMREGLIIIDSRFEEPKAIEGDFAFVLESSGGIHIMPNEIFKENVAIDQENERLRADLRQILNERNSLADAVGELGEKAYRLFNEKEELLRDKLTRQEHTVKKVECALGFTLFDWQKEYIFSGKPYGAEIVFSRRAGKTLAHCLRLCLSCGEPIKAKLYPAQIARNEILHYLGEDGASPNRSQFFIHELRKVYNTLKAVGGIELREITF